ncbi:MAG: helix-turn-helix transcriptional regulator [Alphaproteobacteria bacterium]|jgi:transcriptional regulator with XRE-family HTH domain|nr:helix-turn-helix transcriptional regulator [Alphaproteobacteria bacterium]
MAAGLSMEDLAAEIGAVYQLVQKCENGQRAFTAGEAILIARRLEIDIADLISEATAGAPVEALTPGDRALVSVINGIPDATVRSKLARLALVLGGGKPPVGRPRRRP